MCILCAATIQPSMGCLLESTDSDKCSDRQVSSGPTAVLDGTIPRLMVATGLQKHMVLYGKESWSLVQGSPGRCGDCCFLGQLVSSWSLLLEPVNVGGEGGRLQYNGAVRPPVP